jgi:hypothetical protein
VAYASRVGRARTSVTNPQAHAICDRCGFRYNWVDLRWQFDWRGATMQNIRILVCNDCYDTPQEQLRAIVVPADPTPIINARVQDFALAESDYLSVTLPKVTDSVTGIPIPPDINIVAQNCEKITTQAVGSASSDPTVSRIGLDPNAVMPLNGKLHFNVLLPVLSITTNGTTIVTVTCSAPHKLVAGVSQVAIEGVPIVEACGFFTIRTATATQFTYEVNYQLPSTSLLTDSTRVTTALVGVPIDYPEIPQTGIPGKAIPYVFATGIFVTEDGNNFISENGNDYFVTE